MYNFKNLKKTLIIAEAGVNHNGSLKKAFKLIDIASKAKVDAVKFQMFNPLSVCIPGTEQANYQKKNSKEKDQLSMLNKLALNKSDFVKLRNYAYKKKLEFIATPFDVDSLNFLVKKIKVNLIKVSSGDINNFEILNEIRKLNILSIISTGASNIKDVKKVLKFFYKMKKNSRLAILHCTSDYPAPDKDLNLNCIKTLKKLNKIVGYSDHSKDYFTPSIAVASGAKIIEKHFTISKKLKGPDHKASLNPSELNIMVKLIRETETKMGSYEKKITKSEKKNVKIIRRSIVAKKNIKKNEKFTKKNITCKRPGLGIDAANYLKFLGKKAKKDYLKNSFITS